MVEPEHFFSCDWGTTSFRLRLATVSDGQVIDEIAVPHGVKWILNQLPDGSAAAEREHAFSMFLRKQLAELS